MTLLGLAIILSSLFFTGWWVLNVNQFKSFAVTVCLIAIFVGGFLILQDRIIEFTIENVGTLKTAADKATADAQSISKLRRRIEAQSATIDLIAKDAQSTIEQLQNIASVNAEATLTDLMAGGFMGSITLQTRLALHDRIIDSLKELNVSEDKIESTRNMWNKGVGLIYFRGIRAALEKRTNPHLTNIDISPELRKAAEDFQELTNFEYWEVPPPDEMAQFINERGFMNDKVKQLIDDYRHYIETGKLQRRDVFEKL
jgi:hypothetical protein